jgi:hypothetical protein
VYIIGIQQASSRKYLCNQIRMITLTVLQYSLQVIGTLYISGTGTVLSERWYFRTYHTI